MKRTHYLVLFALLLLCAGLAQANPITDPVIIVRGGTGSINLTTNLVNLAYPGQPGCSSGPYPTNPFPGQPPSSLDGLQSMTCVFKNMTAGPITSLTFNINSAQLPLTLLCGLVCSSFTQTPNGGVATFFFSPGIQNFPPSFEFAVDFINFDPNNTNFTMALNAPEPGTLALLGSGLLAIAGKLRRKKV
jgi:PEP-CTERM motif-containing protein